MNKVRLARAPLHWPRVEVNALVELRQVFRGYGYWILENDPVNSFGARGVVSDPSYR
jgi:hypothetical protein